MADNDSTLPVSRPVTIGGTRYEIHAATAGDLDELQAFGSQLLVVAEHVAASLGDEDPDEGLPSALWAMLRTARSLYGVNIAD